MCSLETLGTIPTSLLVFVENVFTSLVFFLFMECKLHSGNLSLKPWRKVMQVTYNLVLKARTAAVPKGAPCCMIPSSNHTDSFT